MIINGKTYDVNLFSLGTVHKFSPAGASVRNTTAISLGPGGRRIVRVVASAAMNILMGDSTVVATAAASLLPANTVEYFDMHGNTHIAAIGTGDVYVTEMMAGQL